MKIFVLILYAMLSNDPRLDNWSDGFQKALEIIQNNEQNEIVIEQANVVNNPQIDLNKYNIVLIKGGFNGNVHKYAKNFFKINPKKTRVGICISSIKPPTNDDLNFFDVLFYETEWYRKNVNLDRHNNIYHAFGINTEFMKPMNLEKKYDYLFIGNTRAYKRPEKFLEKKGTKLAIAMWLDKKIKELFQKNSIVTLDFVTQDKLAMYYNICKTIYIPSMISGGGERALLEARACNINIEIDNDNPKLAELLTSPIYSSEYYAEQLIKGIKSVCPNDK